MVQTVQIQRIVFRGKSKGKSNFWAPQSGAIGYLHLSGQLVADISVTSPHHFLEFCQIFANFWRKIKDNSVLETRESCALVVKRILRVDLA
jgi:hypothetical protein